MKKVKFYRNSTTAISSTENLQDVLRMSKSSLGTAISIAVGHRRNRIIQFLQLGSSVGVLTVVLCVLSAQIISQSIIGISVSTTLQEYVKIGHVIRALQDERTITCINLSSKEWVMFEFSSQMVRNRCCFSPLKLPFTTVSLGAVLMDSV